MPTEQILCSGNQKTGQRMSDKVQRKFNACLEEKRFFRAGDRVGVAVSGGGDSVGLFHLLEQAAAHRGLQLSLVHLNHQLRGQDSDADESFVGELARSRDLPFFSSRADVAAEARRQHANLEATARRMRYEFFNSLVEKGHVDKIATGHTASDQAETVLLRLLRGSGTRGLAGIYPTLEGRIVRPLLGFTHEELVGFLEENHFPFRIDQSNFDRRFLRNRIRADLLPKLEQEFNPQIVTLLADLAERSRDEEDYLGGEADRWLAQWATSTEGRPSLPLAALRQLAPALERRVLRAAIRSFAGGSASLSHDQMETLRRFAASGSGGGEIQLPRNLIIRKEFGHLVLAQHDSAAKPYRFSVEVPGEQEIPGLGLALRFKIVDTRASQGKYNSAEWKKGIDWQKICTPLVLRNWEVGDRFQPVGHRKPVKLKELLHRHEVSAPRKRLWPLLTAGERIIWVKNLSVESRVAVTPETRQILVIEERKTGGIK